MSLKPWPRSKEDYCLKSELDHKSSHAEDIAGFTIQVACLKTVVAHMEDVWKDIESFHTEVSRLLQWKGWRGESIA